MQRILLIEDDMRIRNLIAMLLKSFGHQVEVAEDGEEGIEIFERFGKFDLVITDIHMPKKDGNQVAKYIRNSKRPETPIVAITAYEGELQRDVFDFSLLKPFRNKALLRILESLSDEDATHGAQCSSCT